MPRFALTTLWVDVNQFGIGSQSSALTSDQGAGLTAVVLLAAASGNYLSWFSGGGLSRFLHMLLRIRVALTVLIWNFKLYP